MLMRKYASIPASDIESYKAVMCFEMAGKDLTLKMDSGATLSLKFDAFPSKKLFAGGSETGIPYDCAKISDQVIFITYQLQEALIAYVLDMEKGLATRIFTGADNKSLINFGTAGDAPDAQAFTDDMGGNKVRWLLGKEDASAFLADYTADGLNITRPFAEGAPAIAASDFKAVKITKEVYLQNFTAQTEGETLNVNLVSNFESITCVGSIYSISATQGAKLKLFAGYGRFIKE